MTKILRFAFASILAMATVISVGNRSDAKEFYKMGTLGPGTSPYLTMSTMATIINQNMKDVEIRVNATGAATKHQIDAMRYKMDFFMTAPTIAAFMRDQKFMYKKLKTAGKLFKNMRLVFWFPLGVYHMTTYADAGLSKMVHLKGKRVFLGPPGGGAWNTAMRLVKAATGMVPGKDYVNVKLGWAAAQQAFQDHRVDVYINPTNAPSPVFEQMAATSKLRFIGISDDEFKKPGVQKLLNRPGGVIGKLKAGTYGKGQVNETDLTVMGSIVGVATHDKMSADMIYKMTKTFWEGVDKMRANAPWVRNIKLETAVMKGPVPFHKGAAKYYKEIGLKLPAANMPK